MLSAARIEQLYPIKAGMDSPNTKISRGNWSLVVVRKFIAERIISYRNRNEHPGILLIKRDFHLQTGNLGYKTGLSFTNGDSWVTNGILGLLFTKNFISLLLNLENSTKNIEKITGYVIINIQYRRWLEIQSIVFCKMLHIS